MKKFESSTYLIITSLFGTALLGSWTIYLNVAQSYYKWIRDAGLLFIAAFILIVSYQIKLTLSDQKMNSDEFSRFKNTEISKFAYLLTLVLCGLALISLSIIVGSVRHGNSLFGQPPIFWIGFEAAIFFTMVVSNFSSLIAKFLIWLKYR